MNSMIGIETSSFTARPPDWPALLAEASTEDEILMIARDQLATWSPEEIAKIPFECRPGRIRDAEDIAQWSFELAKAHCELSLREEADHLLSKMLGFVTQVNERLTVVNAACASEGDRR
jgi:hypothetical protein